jgi:dienelactone hydrolase
MTRRITHLFELLLRVFSASLLVSASALSASAQGVSGVHPQNLASDLGPQTGESAPGRPQQWRVPSGAPSVASRALVFRPAGDGPFRLALIAHASVQNALRRAALPQPDYRALAEWLVARGFAVVVPERPGHGATGGSYLEDQGGCADADYARAGERTADSIAATLAFMRAQPFIRKDGIIVIGHSAGGLGALALAARTVEGLVHIVAFAPGRGGHADDRLNNVCAPDRLVAAVQRFGRNVRTPVTWIVAQNDTYFAPALSKRMADAFAAGGGRVDFRVLPAFGNEGHGLAEKEGGENLWGDVLMRVVSEKR